MATNSHEKHHSDKAEDLEAVHTQIASDEIINLSDEHKSYLLQRHGTLDLDPVPDMNDADPYNWATWKVGSINKHLRNTSDTSKKCTNLGLVAFHAMMATFTAASIQSAFINISEDLGVSLQKTSYLTSLQIAILGGRSIFTQYHSCTPGASAEQQCFNCRENCRLITRFRCSFVLAPTCE